MSSSMHDYPVAQREPEQEPQPQPEQEPELEPEPEQELEPEPEMESTERKHPLKMSTGK